MAKKNFYAVALTDGQTGIFTNWPEAQAFIATCPSNARYKGFGTKTDAERFLSPAAGAADIAVKPHNEPAASEFNVPAGTAIAFVDGSYNQNTRYCGWGFVLFDPNRPDFTPIEACEQTMTGNEHRNVAGEVVAAMKAVQCAKANGFKALVIYHDYQGISSWADRTWKANVPLTRNYVEFMRDAMRDIDISFVKVTGHTGIELNERADILAKTGCGLI